MNPDGRDRQRIADHGFLADGSTAALVAPDGSVDWWCPTRFDAPSVFARLLDPDGGHWAIQPTGPFETHRSYLPDTLVLRTVFRTANGEVAVTDALALAPGARGHEIGWRSPRALIRVVEGLSGTVSLVMSYAPRFEYARVVPYLVGSADAVVATAGPDTLTLRSSVPVERSDDRADAWFTVRAGQRESFTLSHAPTYVDAGMLLDPGADPADLLADTAKAWRSWAGLHTYPGRYPDLVRRSALVLQGLTYQPSAVVVAAATTSLPEQIGGDRNYDYRFAWLRDFSLTIRALWVAACPDEANRLFEWLANAIGRHGDGPVPIMCGVEGERDLTERRLETLRGYAGSAPVRAGNEAWRQRQLDVLGWVLDSAWLLREQLNPMHDQVRELLARLADQAVNTWQRPDAGMWEARDVDRHYLSSKVLCWVALDRATRFGGLLGGPDRVARWSAERDRIRAEVLRGGWHAGVGAYTGAFGSGQLDASVLIMPIVGFLPATDQRMRATIERIDRELTRGGLVRRWSDDPAGFILCSFWLVECLSLAGEQARASALFERVAGIAGELGLLAEQVHLDTVEQLGNFPQAFSHVALINAAWRLTEAGTDPPAGSEPARAAAAGSEPAGVTAAAGPAEIGGGGR